ncbi:uncharacterized protein VTP21DRAFT_3251 [Calcarisporiella thermophila]|uniref:uncharacterized protein n=1 Tax=Calcarisporiella thermophila TaxID=911321 RepID=UPI003743BDFA
MTTPNIALIIIDVQKGFTDHVYWGGERNNPQAEAQISRILEHFRAKKYPIFHIQHASTRLASPLHPSKPGHELKDEVKPLEGEPVLKKTVNCAFFTTDLEERLRAQNIQELVITGLTTNHCVSTTARVAGDKGYKAYVVADASATFAREGDSGEIFDPTTLHEMELAILKDEFATIVTTEEVLKLVV